MMSCLYFAPGIVHEFLERLHEDNLKRDDISLIADIVRLMTALNLSHNNLKESTSALSDFLEIDKKGAKELLLLTKGAPLPIE